MHLKHWSCCSHQVNLLSLRGSCPEDQSSHPATQPAWPDCSRCISETYTSGSGKKKLMNRKTLCHGGKARCHKDLSMGDLVAPSTHLLKRQSTVFCQRKLWEVTVSEEKKLNMGARDFLKRSKRGHFQPKKKKSKLRLYMTHNLNFMAKDLIITIF